RQPGSPCWPQACTAATGRIIVATEMPQSSGSRFSGATHLPAYRCARAPHNSQSQPHLCWQTPVHGCHSVQRMAPGMSAATPGAQTAFAPVASSVFLLLDSRETPA
ncbi:uncharacterized protein METZ01_LOCUS11120, partial [marine metagenome]